MSKKKLAVIIVACIVIVGVIVVVVTTAPRLTPTPTYTLSVSVSPSGAGSVSPLGGEYESGEQVTLTASPATGYLFNHWSGDVSGTISTITITMDSNKSLTAHFVEKFTLSITVSPSGAGSVSPVGGECESGEQVTLTASPASGYTFDHWSSDASGTSSSITIIMDRHKGVIAHFREASTTPPPASAGLVILSHSIRTRGTDNCPVVSGQAEWIGYIGTKNGFEITATFYDSDGSFMFSSSEYIYDLRAGEISNFECSVSSFTGTRCKDVATYEITWRKVFG